MTRLIHCSSLCFVAAAACVPELEDDLSIIAEPRLIALRSVPAEVAEGQSVRFEALVAAPSGAAQLAPSFQLCSTKKPLTELGPVSPACLVAGGAFPGAAELLGSGSEVEAQVSRDACRLFGPRRPEPRPGEPAGRPVDPDDTGGFYQPVIAWLGDGRLVASGVRLQCGPSGATREALLDYAARYRRNENPELARVELLRDDQEPVLLASSVETEPARIGPGESVRLRASWASCPRIASCGDAVCGANEDARSCQADCAVSKGCSGAESYVSFDLESRSVVDRKEDLVLSFYTTAGRFSSERSGPNDADPDEANAVVGFRAPAGEGTLDLWIVIRDDRGGSGWVHVPLIVARP